MSCPILDIPPHKMQAYILEWCKDAWRNDGMLLFIAFYTFAIFSLGLYAVVAYLMVRERKTFSSVFTRLWLLFAAVNMITFVTMFFFYRIPEVTPRGTDLALCLEQFPFPNLLRVMHFISYYSLYCQNLLLFLIVINRLKVIIYPLGETVFEKHFWITALSVLSLPLFLCVPIFNTEAKFFYNKRISGYVLRGVDKTDETEDLIEVTVFQCAVAIINAIINVVSIILMWRRTMAPNNRRELNLFLICFFCFVLQMTNAALTFLLAVYSSDPRMVSFVLYVRPITTDIFSLGMPYYTLFLNLHLRRCLMKLPILRTIFNSPLKEPLINNPKDNLTNMTTL